MTNVHDGFKLYFVEFDSGVSSRVPYEHEHAQASKFLSMVKYRNMVAQVGYHACKERLRENHVIVAWRVASTQIRDIMIWQFLGIF